jgi:hypothetical protein
MTRSASLIVLALLVSGCALSPKPDVHAFAENSGANSFEVFERKVSSSQALVLPVVHDRQQAGSACGAHVLASVVNYWRGPGTLHGEALFEKTPPQSPSGYSMAELLTLAKKNGLAASAVRLSSEDIKKELEAGRPVLVPIRLPSIYVQQRSLPGADVPVLGWVRNSIIYRAGKVQEMTKIAMVDHYLLVAGYEPGKWVVLEPVMGFRTISDQKLARYREHFGNASIVFSKPQAKTALTARPKG